MKTPRDNPNGGVTGSTERICFANGRTEHFHDQSLAYALWLSLPKGIRAAFRSKADTRPVYSWDYVDAP